MQKNIFLDSSSKIHSFSRKNEKHKEIYNASEIKIKKQLLEKSRKNKNWKIEERLIKAKRYTQKVDPEYLNIYMKAYHKKDI